jgi:hypothetical protein
MAISTLTPCFRVCFTENCSKILVYDTTDVETIANPGGWGDSNVFPVAIEAATITYVNPVGTSEVIDVIVPVNAETTVTGEFLIGEIPVINSDGVNTFKYVLTIGGVSVSKTLTTYSLCNVRCCVDKLWAKVASDALGEDCKCSGEKTTAIEKAELAEGLYAAIQYGASCNSSDIKNEILKKLQRICKLENCNCK